MPEGAEEAARRAIVLVHGIRDRANWHNMVADILRAPDVEVISVGYDYFDLFRFLVPGPWRRGPIERARQELASALARYPGEKSRVSVIAHSYGTYAISRVLAENRAMRLEHLVLCGSIAKMSGYDWGATLFQVQGTVINDYGVKDPWPVMAKSVTWGFGDPGTYGMRIDRVANRDHDFGHSGFMQESFVRDFWKTFFVTGEVLYPDHKGARPTQPWWFRVLGLPWKWIAILAVVLGAVWLAQPQVRYAIVRWLDQTIDSRAVDLRTLLSIDCDLKLAAPTAEELAAARELADVLNVDGWLIPAIDQIGQREVPGHQANPQIVAYNAAVGVNETSDEKAWNGQFVGWALRQDNLLILPPDQVAWARNWGSWGYDTMEIGDIVTGSVVVTQRPEDPTGGVVGFYLNGDAEAAEPSIRMLAGNICGAVSVVTVPESLVLNYRMPDEWQGPGQ